MPFDGELPTMTTTAHKVENLTTTSALALYDSAITTADKVRAAAAMAHVLRNLPVAAPRKARKAVEPETGVLTAERLSKALKAVREVIERKSTVPILANVRLWTTEGRLNLAGTDLDRYVETFVSAEGLETMDVTVGAERLAKVLSGAKGVVELRLVEEAIPALDVVAGGQTSRLPSIPSGEFPVMSLVQPTCAALMDVAMLRDALAFVQPGISTEETRYYLNGVYMARNQIEGQSMLTFVSTDGHRMFVQNAPDVEWEGNLQALSGTSDGTPGIIIPREVVKWALRNLPKEGEVLVEISQLQIAFTVNDSVFRAKLIDGNFPDYTRVVPDKRDALTLIHGDGIAIAEELAPMVSLSSERSCSVNVEFKAGAVTAMVRDMEGGRASRTLSAEGMGEAETWGVNGKYLMDAINQGAVVMAFRGQNTPIRVDYPAREDRFSVLMPLRV